MEDLRHFMTYSGLDKIELLSILIELNKQDEVQDMLEKEYRSELNKQNKEKEN
jgi:hypothetical protein